LDRGAPALDFAPGAPNAAQRIAIKEYVLGVQESTEHVARLSRAIEQELITWRWRPLVQVLHACRGIAAATSLVGVLGGISLNLPHKA
jgi:hypothetical protein